MNYIDIRSDTVTLPTEQMREAMAQAIVGDDVYREDPTVKELEAYAASLTAKEDALFVPSGTFGNQLALFTHCKRGTEVILDDSCHIVQHEAGASSIIAGVQLRTIDCSQVNFDATCIQEKIRTGSDIHEPETSLICIENAHSNGTVMGVSEMEEVRRCADRHHLPIHLDGARLFNAATYLGINAKDITQHVDSVMFCLSKGLCAPVGSILAGNKKFIEQARKKRKIMGGGLRQAGFLAAAGLVALKDERYRLEEDHKNAQLLAEKLSEIPGIVIEPSTVHINIVFFTHTSNETIDSEAFVDFMKSKGILVNPADSKNTLRFVTHRWITREHINIIVNAVKDFYE